MVQKLPVLAVLQKFSDLIMLDIVLHQLVLIDVFDEDSVVFQTVAVEHSLVQAFLRRISFALEAVVALEADG